MHLLVVDDHPEVRDSLAGFLGQLGHTVEHADDGLDALAHCRTRRPDLVLSDLRMPNLDGLGLLARLEELDDPPPFALMTAFGDAQTAIEALRLGAVDYLRKPIQVAELHRLVERLTVPAPAAALSVRTDHDGLLVVGDELERLVSLADRLHLAPDLPCLVEGETGTGKELFARRLHHGGQAATGPFIAINCAAIPDSLFEAELFGYTAGAFTGASSAGAEGKCAAAAGGTLFLDEIGDLPTDQQAKLLRLLEARTFYPVGSARPKPLEARVVCATNRRLLERVRTGAFREDLYYRLKVGHLRLPPLRERRDTVPALALAFLGRIRQKRGRGFQRLSSPAATLMTAYDWPGNVRQLLHVLEQAGLLHDGAVLDEAHLRPLLDDAPPRHVPTPPPGHEVPLSDVPAAGLALRLPKSGFALDDWQRAVITGALELNDGSPVRTAAYLRISRKVLYTLRKRYGLLGAEEGE